MSRVLLVLAGGGLGSVARYLTTIAFVRFVSADFPYGTLAVNLIGCFLIGFVHTFGVLTLRLSPDTRLFLTTGVMGGLTTYSSFNYEGLTMIAEGQSGRALIYVLAMMAGCAAAGLLGVMSARAAASMA
jgi:CrcB protein